jgi:hypothetical protein
LAHSPTEEQKCIIYNDSKYIEVQAGPGTGKTYTLLRRIEILIQNGILLPTEKILFCTYTNALTSNNLQSLVQDGNIDISKIRVTTLDSFIVDFLCKLNISDLEKNILLNFENSRGYQEARNVARRLLLKRNNEVTCLLQFMVARYPYIFVDEIQDIKDKEDGHESPKHLFLQRLKACCSLKQMIIVGDSKQSIYNREANLQAYTFDGKPLKLTVSKRKMDHSGEELESILQAVINSKDTERKTVKEAIQFLTDGARKRDTMIILQDFTNFPHKKELENLPTFWYGGTVAGHYTLPQAFINSIFWYQDLCNGTVSQSLDSILLPFKPILNKHLTFPYFKCRYFQQLIMPNQTFRGILFPLLEMALIRKQPKVIQLQTFHDNHSHIHTRPINSFNVKFIVTTIDSAKGLEADDVYFILNGNSRSDQHNFVAHTRHKKKLYICQN